MSSFLLNLARRAAGVPVGAGQAPAPSPIPDAVRAPNLDTGETETSGLEAPDASTPAAAPAAGGALTPPAIQRVPAIAEPAPAPPDVMRSAGLEHGTQAPVPARTTELTGPGEATAPTSLEPSPRLAVLEKASSAAAPADLEPADSASLRTIVETRIVAAVSGGEPSSESVADVTAEHPVPRPPAPSAPVQDRPVSTAPVATQPDRPLPVIRPAAAALSPPPRLPRPPLASPGPVPPTPAPVHVRIGRIEVRGVPAPAPRQPAAASAPATLGFGAYTRVRTYRNWPR